MAALVRCYWCHDAWVRRPDAPSLRIGSESVPFGPQCDCYRERPPPHYAMVGDTIREVYGLLPEHQPAGTAAQRRLLAERGPGVPPPVAEQSA